MPSLPEDLNLQLLHICAASSLSTLLSLILTDKSFHASFNRRKQSILQTAVDAHLLKSLQVPNYEADQEQVQFIEVYPNYYSSNLALARLSAPNFDAASADVYIQRPVKQGMEVDIPPTVENLQAALGMHQKLCWLVKFLRSRLEAKEPDQAKLLSFGDWYTGATVELLNEEFQRLRRMDSWGWRERFCNRYSGSMWETRETSDSELVVKSLENRSRDLMGCYWGPEEAVPRTAEKEAIWKEVWRPSFAGRPLLMLELCVQRTQEMREMVVERAKHERAANAKWMDENKWLRVREPFY